jgi:hypothetical protein
LSINEPTLTGVAPTSTGEPNALRKDTLSSYEPLEVLNEPKLISSVPQVDRTTFSGKGTGAKLMLLKS